MPVLILLEILDAITPFDFAADSIEAYSSIISPLVVILYTPLSFVCTGTSYYVGIFLYDHKNPPAEYAFPSHAFLITESCTFVFLSASEALS